MTADIRSSESPDERPSIQKNPESGLIYKTLFATAQKDPTILMDAGFRIMSINEAAAFVYGLDDGQVNGKTIREAIKLDVADSVREKANQQVQEVGFSICEGSYRRKDGRVFQLTFVFNKIVDKEGQAIGYTSVAKDVTESRHSGLKAISAINMINHSSDAIFTTDNDLTIESWSKGAERLYGVATKDAVGKKVGEIFKEPQRLNHVTRQQILDEVEKNGSWTGFLHNNFEGVGEIFVHAAIDRSFDIDSNPVGYVVVHRELNREMAIAIKAHYMAMDAR